MGYTTDFEGSFDITGKMDKHFVNYIERFAATRHMVRDNEKIKELFPNWKEYTFDGENLGVDGEYFLTPDYRKNMGIDDSVLDHNRPSQTQPELWCQWVLDLDNEADLENNDVNEFTGRLEWDGGEKFYCYVEWLEYLVINFFAPMKLELNGTVLAVGESTGDASYIIVSKNKVTVYNACDKNVYDEVKTDFSSNRTVMNGFEEVYKTVPELVEIYWQ